MIKVILDTNFLIYCAKEKLDYVEEIDVLVREGHKLVVPVQVKNELVKLRDDKKRKVTGKDKIACSLALQLLEFNKIEEVSPIGKNVDEAIINLANENEMNIVATLDREMRHTLGRVILINKGKKLMLTK